MAVPSTNCIAWWLSTAASIPSGWSRDTSFDGRYFQGSTSSFTTPANGGGTTHTHAFSHTHTGNSHNHTFTGASATSTGTGVDATGSTFDVARTNHAHTLNGSSQAKTITYNTTDPSTTADGADPPFVRAIALVPNDTSQLLPADIVVLGNSIPNPDWRVCDGTFGTANLDGLYLFGAAAAGDGGATGGSATHDHDVPAHTHTETGTHQHGGGVSAGQAIGGFWTCDTGAGLARPRGTHHIVPIGAVTAGAVNNSSVVATGTASNEPAYVQAYALQNRSGYSKDVPVGIILGFKGAYSSIPAGWQHCDGTNGTPDTRDRQVKITTSAGSLNATAGANTHDHTQSHGHTHAASHSGTASGVTMTGEENPIAGASVPAAFSHSHVWTINATTPTMQDNAANVDAADGRQPYRTMLFIMRVLDPVVILKGRTTLVGPMTMAAA